MDTIFTKIIKGEIPCYKIAENEHCFAFLDISPLSQGHTLVVPKIQEDYIFDLDDELLAELTIFSKKVAAAIRKIVPCERIAVAVIGLDVPHAHIHLIPIQQDSILDFKAPRVKLSAAEMSSLATEINKASTPKSIF